jgi:large subunit ribosomal protein L30
MAKAKTAPSAGKQISITLKKSPIGFKNNQAAIVQGIGLRRLNHTVTLKDTPEVRGMVFKVRHLVEVSE